MKPEERIGKYLRDRKPSSEEERSALDHVWKDLRGEGDSVPTDVLRDFQAVRPMSRRFLWGAVAAVVVIAVVLPALLVRNFRQSSAPAVAETADGKSRLAFGEIVRASGGAGEVLALADGSRVEMRSQSELSIERANDGVRIRLNKGSVIVSAAKQGAGHLYVQTKDVTVSVVGTVFLVNSEEAGSRVAVIQGEVSVQQGPTLKKLLPGEQVATNPIMQSVPVIEEIQWSRNVLAHLALLQQSISVPPPAPPPTAARLEFEVASIKPCAPGERGGVPGERGRGGGGGGGLSPGRLNLPCSTVDFLIRQAYLFYANGQGRSYSGPVPISGGPAWINSDRYQINATAAGNPSQEMMMGPILQALLEDRFKLKIRRDSKEVSVFALTVVKGGSKLQQFKEGSCFPSALGNPLPPIVPGQEPPRICGFSLLRSNGPIRTFDLYAMSLDQFSRYFAGLLGRPIIDRTGIPGLFDFHLEFAADESTPSLLLSPPGAPPSPVMASDPAGPSIFTAFQEQLGLKLEPTKGPGEFLVIDGIERPTEN